MTQGRSDRARRKQTYTSIEAVRSDLYPGSELPPVYENSSEMALRTGREIAQDVLAAIRQSLAASKSR